MLIHGLHCARPPIGRLPAIADKDRRIEVRLVMSTNQEVVGAVLKELGEHLKSIDELIH